ncbi:MAG TPA: folylpolyglutamate synthase/dihydrofolate synthase family protein [Bryobacteraceae bacterium]|jgi:dihydrofolate synthase/folylpolyglutamate synthase
MNYPDSVHFLYALGNEIKTAKLGLERIRTVLDALGRPQDRRRFVHVAGTNGKGSVSAMIESGLRAGGSTGLFTSPHLKEPTERIRLNGVPVDETRFTEAFDRVHAVVEGLLSTGALDLHTTYFETVTAMALVIFAAEQTGIAVMEVGLGGRLDATNVIEPELCVITPVDFDHEAFLGKSLEAIAGEKAGILKAGVPAVFSRQRDEADKVLNLRAAELSIPVARTNGWTVYDLELDARGSRFLLSGERDLHIRCPLAGEHQVENAATAAVALTRLGASTPAIEEGIAQVKWPGRLERISERPEIIVDGAHNPAGARAVAAYIDRFYANRRVTLIYGAMRDKAVAEIGGILFSRAQQVIVTAARQTRAMSPETLREVADHPDVRVAATLPDALAMAQDADVVFITGSLFLVAEARELLGAK